MKTHPSCSSAACFSRTLTPCRRTSSWRRDEVPPRRAAGKSPGPEERLSSLQALLALSMRMTDTEDERQILHLAGTAVPFARACRLLGAFLVETDGSWCRPTPPRRELLADVETQLAVVGHRRRGHRRRSRTVGLGLQLRSLGAHFGYLAVSADAEPTAGEQFLLRVLAQQAGVALANARLHARQRGQAAELLATNNRLAGTLAALERNMAIHDRLTQVAVAGEGQEGIAEAVHELTGFAVAVEDRHGNLRAWAGPDSPDPYLKESPEPARRSAPRPRAGAPIRHDGRLLAVARPRDDISASWR